MAIEIFSDPYGRRCLLVDSVTERALSVPAFASLEHAESFEQWVRACTGKDPRAFDAADLDDMHTSWLALPKCEECQLVLTDGKCRECDE